MLLMRFVAKIKVLVDLPATIQPAMESTKAPETIAPQARALAASTDPQVMTQPELLLRQTASESSTEPDVDLPDSATVQENPTRAQYERNVGEERRLFGMKAKAADHLELVRLRAEEIKCGAHDV
jgi:hypothetical protein